MVSRGFSDDQNRAFCLLMEWLHRRTMRQSRHTDCPPVALLSVSQKREVSVFHLPTMADSAAFCTEAKTSHHDRLSMQCRSIPHYVMLNVAHFFLHFLLLPPTLHRQILNRCATFTQVYRSLPVPSNCITARWAASLEDATRTEYSTPTQEPPVG
jgi:hypothetical protein